MENERHDSQPIQQPSTAMKWVLGVAASILTAVIVAFIFGGIDARENIAVMRTELSAMKVAVERLSVELSGRPRYDANQALANQKSQEQTDAAQNKVIEMLTSISESMDKRQVRFDERLSVLERRLNP